MHKLSIARLHYDFVNMYIRTLNYEKTIDQHFDLYVFHLT
jgi:hypothetical protein